MSLNELALINANENNINQTIDLLNKSCSINKHGLDIIEHEAFVCKFCDPEENLPICDYCLENCHKLCDDNTKKKSYLGKLEYVCNCGNSKHNVKISDQIDLNIKCKLYHLDKYIINSKKKNNLCFLCSEICYEDNDIEIPKEESNCSCKHKNHILNSHLFLTNKDNLIEKLKLSKIFFPIQIINFFFKSNILDFTNFIYSNFNSLDSNNIINDKVKFNYFSIFTTKFFNYNYKKAYYYNEKFFRLFEFKKLVNVISRTNIKNFNQDCYYSKSLIHYLFFIHIKSDFSLLRGLSIYDILNSSIFNRINIEKKNEHVKKINVIIFEKYTNNKFNLFLKIAEFLKLEEFKSYFPFKIMILRIIYYILKKRIFTIEALNSLIDILYDSENLIFFNNNENNKSFLSMFEQRDKENINDIKAVIKYLTKIYFLISININDIVFKNKLENKNSLYNYIHCDKKHGIKLFAIIMNLCKYYNINKKFDTPILDAESSTIYNEVLKLFIVTDNFYFKNILGYKKMKSLDIYDPIVNNDNEIKNLVLNLRDNLKNEIINFYNYEVNFKFKIKEIFDKFNHDINILLNKKSEFSEKDIKLSFYNNEIIKYSCEKFNFVENKNFFKSLYQITNEMQVLNIDEIITEITFYLCQIKDENSDEKFNYLLSFLSIYCFQKETLLYLLNSKNINRILEISKINDNNLLLKFLYIIFKGKNVHSVVNKYNKNLSIICNNLIRLAEKYKNTNKEEDKSKLILIIKILNLIENQYDFDEFKKIKGEIILIFIDNILTIEKFKLLYPLIDDNNLNINNKFKYSEELKLEDISIYNNSINKEEKNNYLNNNNLYSKLDEQLYFILMKFITHTTFCFFDNEYFMRIYEYLRKFNDIDFFSKLLKKDVLNLKQRIILLQYMITIYIPNIISISHKHKHLLFADNEYYSKKSYGKKIKYTNDLIKIIDIFSEELHHVLSISLINSKSKDLNIKKYTELLLFSIKNISDVIFVNKDNLYNYILLQYYKLIYNFLKHVDIFRINLNYDDPISLQNEINIYKDNPTYSNEIILENMNEVNFNYFDIEKTYNFFMNEYTNLLNNFPQLKSYELRRFLKNHDKKVKLNLYQNGIIYDGEYESFYKDLPKNKEIEYDSSKQEIYKDYVESFYKIKNNVFHKLLINNSFINKHNKYLVKYFFLNIYYDRYINDNYELSIFKIIDKMFYLSTEMFQDILNEIMKKYDRKIFFNNLFAKLQKCIALSKSISSNIFIPKRFIKYNLLGAKLITQFFQLLGEGFCTKYYEDICNFKFTNNLIKQDNKLINNKKFKYFIDFIGNNFGNELVKIDHDSSVNNDSHLDENHLNTKEIIFYEYIMDELIDIFKHIKFDAISECNYTLPNDHLILLINFLFNILIEFNTLIDDKILNENNECLLDLFKTIKIIIFNKRKDLKDIRKKILMNTKIVCIKFLISILYNNKISNIRIYNELFKIINIGDLFDVAILHLLDEFKNYNQENNLGSDEFLDKLKILYLQDIDFQKSLQLQFSIEVFKYMKSSSSHIQNEVEAFYNNPNKPNQLINIVEDNYKTKNGKNVYDFLNYIVKCVEIRDPNSNENVKNFFLNPPYTDLLSETTSLNFNKYADRSSHFNKLNYLINQSDYLMFEMIINYYKYINKKSKSFQQNILGFYFLY